MSNGYDYQNDQQQPPQQPLVFSPLGAPLAALAGLMQPNRFGYMREASLDDTPQPSTSAQAQPQGGQSQPPPQPPPQPPQNGQSQRPPTRPAVPNPNTPVGSPENPSTIENDPGNPIFHQHPRPVGPWKPFSSVDGRPYQPPSQPQSPPQPPEPYIPTPANRPPDQWATPDFVWRGAQKYPGISPGPFMPQKNEIAGLLHSIVMGLGRFGSHHVGMPAIAMGTYASAYWNAYQKGMKERAAQNWQQYRQARQMTLDRQKDELTAEKEAYALYSKNPDKLQAALESIAHRYGDQPMLNALASGNLAAVDSLLQARDGHWNSLSKIALQDEKLQAEIARIKAQTELERARIDALRKGGQDIPPDYEDPDTTAPGDQTTDGDQAADGDLTADDGDRGDAGTGDLQDQGTLGLAAARNKPGGPAGAPPAVSPVTPSAPPPPPGFLGARLPGFPGRRLGSGTTPSAGAAPGTAGQVPAAAPGAAGAATPTTTGEAPARSAAGTAPAPGAPDQVVAPGATGAAPGGGVAGMPPIGAGAPPRGVPLDLPPAHFVPSGMTRSQLDFEAQRYYESGRDLYPAKQIAENTAIHRRASQINTFVNRLIDHYRPGIDSEQQLLDNIGRAEPNVAGALRDILAGGEPLPRAGSGASEYNRLISQLPARIRPGFSGQVYAARQKIANDYAPGGYMGRMIFAENRLAPAALEVVRTARALPQGSNAQTNFESAIEAYVKGKVIGDPEYSNFFVAWRAYVSELVRIQRGGTGAEADIQEQIKNIAPSSSLRQILGGLRTDAKITIPAMDDAKRYWDSMGMGYEMPLYDQRAHDTLDSIMNRLDPETGNFFGTEPSGMRGEFIMTDAKGNRRLYVGQGDPHTDRDPGHWIKPAERLPGQ